MSVRGHIDGLDLDLRPWLVVRTDPDDKGWLYPQRQVRRNNPEYQEDIWIGRAPRGIDDGGEFDILLVAVDFEGDFDLFHAVKADEHIGHRLPAGTTILDSKRVIRRDIRSQR